MEKLLFMIVDEKRSKKFSSNLIIDDDIETAKRQFALTIYSIAADDKTFPVKDMSFYQIGTIDLTTGVITSNVQYLMNGLNGYDDACLYQLGGD